MWLISMLHWGFVFSKACLSIYNSTDSHWCELCKQIIRFNSHVWTIFIILTTLFSTWIWWITKVFCLCQGQCMKPFDVDLSRWLYCIVCTRKLLWWPMVVLITDHSWDFTSITPQCFVVRWKLVSCINIMLWYLSRLPVVSTVGFCSVHKFNC